MLLARSAALGRPCPAPRAPRSLLCAGQGSRIHGRHPVIVAAAGGKPRDPGLVATSAPDVGGAPPPEPEPLRVDSGRAASSSGGGGGSGEAGPSPLKLAWRKLLRELSSLPRAIALMAAIAALSGLGTVVPQNKSLEYYMTSYPDGPDKVLGFLSYDVLLGLQLDHVYSAWYFYLLMALLGASLIACTTTTQWPAAKVAQRWRFAPDARGVQRAAAAPAQVLPNARLADLGAALAGRGYQVFRQGPQLYAFKGLAGRLGPIGVHATLILALVGTAYSGFGGWKGSAMVPQGQEFLVSAAIRPQSAISSLPAGAKAVMRVDGFRIETRPDGSVAQFFSDLSLRDLDSGRELRRKTISVNDPFRYGGVTMYQTDWSIAAVTIRVPGADVRQAPGGAAAPPAADAGAAAYVPQGQPFSLPLASLAGQGGTAENAKIWATFLPIEAIPQDGRAPKGISIIARDLDTVTLYDSTGNFAGVRRPGSGKPITVDGVTLIVDAIVGSTGLEIKSDPGVPLVYAGFGGIMVTTLVSYVSHSQVWGLQDGPDVVVAGRSNRSKFLFERELDAALDAVPEA
ncbi:MAG: c-type cytochrome synthesis 1 [Monoraphidium minutum]|nr:MAG: c-type cytochrome synthesis 1 [Monoraphidium minutum]